MAFCYNYLAANELELLAEYEKVKEGTVQNIEIYEPDASERDFWVALIEVTVLEPWMKGWPVKFTFAVTWLNEILDISVYHCPIIHKRWRDPIRAWVQLLRKNLK